MLTQHGQGIVETSAGWLQPIWEQAADGDTVLTALHWVNSSHQASVPLSVLPSSGLESLLQAALQAYFSHGDDEALQSLPVHWEGTPFQQRVWQAAQAIPFGHTVTYGQVGDYIGCQGGAQAIGQALKKNPLPLIIPCHRVVAAGYRYTETQSADHQSGGGAMGGYMGEMNSPIKQHLLAYEQSKTLAASHVRYELAEV